MPLLHPNFNPARKELTVFALTWLLFFSVLGVYVWIHGRPAAALCLFSLAVVVPSIGLLFPVCLKYLFVAASWLAFPIGFVVSHVVILLIYYGLLTPIGLLMRAVSHDPLERRFEPRASSYWKERRQPSPVARYFRQS